jgi:hypothetical protein
MRRRARPQVAVLARLALAVFTLAALGAAGCGDASAPPPIAADTPCSSCGMSASNPRFACERRDGRGWRVFDSIECMARENRGTDAASVWLPDYDQARLHRADSLWIVRGKLATPMGGGLVALLDRRAAEALAGSCDGRVARWGDPALTAGGAR